jgi:hypothetical protein
LTKKIKCSRDYHQYAFDALVEHGYVDPEKYHAAFKKFKGSEAEFSRSVLKRLLATNFGALCTALDGASRIPIAYHRNKVYAEHTAKIDREFNLALPLFHKIRELKETIKGAEKQLRSKGIAIDAAADAKAGIKDLKAKVKDLEKEAESIMAPQKLVTLMMVPRGCLKSTFFAATRAFYLYLRDRLVFGQSPVVLLLHADVKKARQNLVLVKKIAKSELIKDVFNDWTIEIKDDADSYRFEDDSPINRKEPHLYIGSAGQEFGGEHATYYMVDDWALDNNTDTVDKNKFNKDAFWKLYFLNDHSGRFRIEMVGTHYLDDSIYCELLEKRDNGEPVIESTIVPAYEVKEDNVIEWNFEEVKMYHRDEIHKLKNMLPAKKFNSQVLMQPQPRSKEVEFNLGDNYIFKFPREHANASCVAPMTLDQITEHGCVITSKDPSYSTTNKSWGSNVSKDTTITGVVFGDCLYIYEAEQLLGGSNDEIYRPLLTQVERNQSDVVIIDAQGTQKAFVSVLEQWLERDLDYLPHFIKYTKPGNLTSSSKADRAMMALSTMFNMGKIKVHHSCLGLIAELQHSCLGLIAELQRETRGWDYLDTMIMIFSHQLPFWESLGKSKMNSNVVPLAQRPEFRARVKQKVFRRTGG